VKLITRDTDYALRAVCFIAKNKDKIVSVSTLVKELKIPKPFLRKLLQVLSKRRLLRSQRGLGGGFLLARPGDKIFLMDLMRIFQGGLRLNECFFKKMPCPNLRTCALRKKIDKIEAYVIRELKAITIQSLIRSR